MCSASLDKKICFFDITQKKMVKKLETEYPLTALGFSPDGFTLAAGTLNGKILIYDLRQSQSVKSILNGHDGQINYIEF